MLISLGILAFYIYKNEIRPNQLEQSVYNSKRYQTKLKLLLNKSLKKSSFILCGDSVLESLSFENESEVYKCKIRD